MGTAFDSSARVVSNHRLWLSLSRNSKIRTDRNICPTARVIYFSRYDEMMPAISQGIPFP